MSNTTRPQLRQGATTVSVRKSSKPTACGNAIPSSSVNLQAPSNRNHQRNLNPRQSARNTKPTSLSVNKTAVESRVAPSIQMRSPNSLHNSQNSETIVGRSGENGVSEPEQTEEIGSISIMRIDGHLSNNIDITLPSAGGSTFANDLLLRPLLAGSVPPK